MAATVSWDALRELAGFRALKGCAISLYLDLDPRVAPTAGDVETRVNSLLDEARRRLDRGDLTHDQRLALQDDLAHIRRFFDEELNRDGAHGLAIFAASLDNLWRPVALADAVPDAVRINTELYLTPLVPLVGRGEGVLVAAVSRERGELFCLRGGRLDPVVDRSEEQPGKHDQGGWSQARYQRHIENLVHEHLRDVAEELDRRVRVTGERIVIIAPEETRADLDDLLSKEVHGALIGWAQAEAHAGPSELLAAVAPLIGDWRARQERAAVERWREEAGRNGRAAAGWASTLEAVSDGRVDLLLYRHGVERAAWRCPACGRLTAQDGPCPLDATHMERSDEGLDLAVHHALSNGGTVCAIGSHDLDPVEGIGALLRY